MVPELYDAYGNEFPVAITRALPVGHEAGPSVHGTLVMARSGSTLPSPSIESPGAFDSKVTTWSESGHGAGEQLCACAKGTTATGRINAPRSARRMRRRSVVSGRIGASGWGV